MNYLSYLYYFASDNELNEQPNPYIKLLSINEALELGIEVDLDMFENDIDRDEPDVILYCDDKEKMDYPNIYAFDKDNYYEEIGTHKRFCTALELDSFSDENLQLVLNYVQTQLKHTKEIEIWCVWLGEYNINKTVKKALYSINDLKIDLLRKFYENSCDNKCMIISK